MLEDFDFNAYFADIDKQKKEMAEKTAQKNREEEEKRRKNSAGEKFRRFLFGSSPDEMHEFTEEELTLMASIDNADSLTLDDNGRIIRIEDSIAKNEKIPEKTQTKVKKKKTYTNETNIISLDDEEAVEVEEEPEIPESERRKVALRNALAHQDEDDELDSYPVENVEVQHVETLSSSEVRLYIATSDNKKTSESSYGYYLEQGSGSSKITRIGGEKYFKVSKEALGYFAAAQALYPFANFADSGIKKITIIATRDISWNLYHNGWDVQKNNVYFEEAEMYSQSFTACSENGIKIYIVFAEANNYGHQFAKNIAEALVASAQ